MPRLGWVWNFATTTWPLMKRWTHGSPPHRSRTRCPDPAAWPIAYPDQRRWPPPLPCELLLDELLLDELPLDELPCELLPLLDELPCELPPLDQLPPCELPPLDQLPLCDGADGGGLVCTGAW